MPVARRGRPLTACLLCSRPRYTRNDDPDFEPGIKRIQSDPLPVTTPIVEESRSSPASEESRSSPASSSRSSKRASTASTGSMAPDLSPSSSIRALTQSPAASLKASPKGASPAASLKAPPPSPAGTKRISESPPAALSGKKARTEGTGSPAVSIDRADSCVTEVSIAHSRKDGACYVVLAKDSPAVTEIHDYFGKPSTAALVSILAVAHARCIQPHSSLASLVHLRNRS